MLTEADPIQTEANVIDMENIRRRARELSIRLPEHEGLFSAYVSSQENEYKDLEEALTGVVWLLQGSSIME